MNYVLPLWTPPALKVVGTEDEFPIRRVHCVGKNYGDHVREMGGDPQKVKPTFFSKSAHAIVGGVEEVSVAYPRATQDLHHEVELVVALGADAKVFGYAIGIDFTKRDLQGAAKKAGLPWDTSKNFAGAGVVSQITPLDQCGNMENGAISLSVNGELRQEGDLAQMVYSVAEILEHLESFDALLPGDLIFTGTPAGVGEVKAGDVMTCKIAGLPDFSVKLV